VFKNLTDIGFKIIFNMEKNKRAVPERV